MNTNDYKKSITVSKPANEAYAAITEHIGDWWSDDLSGASTKKGDRFNIAFGETRKTFEIVEAIPGGQVIWLCLEAHIDMAALTKKDEWEGTRLIWTIAGDGNGSTLTLLHEGLNKSLQCYDVCESGWDYFMASLHAFLTTGTGTPHHKKVADSYQCSIAADVTPLEAFDAINRVNEWWAKNFEGSAEKLNDVFTVRFSSGTFVTFEVDESIPGEKIAWRVTDCYLPWLKHKTEWNGTTVVFEISPLGDETMVAMTHIGLVPGIECYEDCEAGWNKYVKESLFKLLTGHAGVPQ